MKVFDKKIVAIIIVAISLLLVLLPIFSMDVSVADASSGSLYYGRDFLATKGNRFVQAYDAICNGVASRRSGEHINLSLYNLTSDECAMVFQMYYRDHGEHYWLPSTRNFATNSSGRVEYIYFNYLTGFDDALFASETQKFLEVAEGLTSEYEIALALHDELVSKVTYKTSAVGNGSDLTAYNAYGAIVDKTCVCEGYAEAYQYLLRLKGIQSFLVSGRAQGENHRWNLVRLDGKYYYTDVTWDDPVINNDELDFKPIVHAYFNVTTQMLSEDHEQIDDEYNMLPVCDDTSKVYHNMPLLSSYDVDSVANAFVVNGYIAVAEVYFTGATDNFNAWFNTYRSAVMSRTAFAGKQYHITPYTISNEHIIVATVPQKHAVSMTLENSKVITVGESEILTPTLFPSDSTDILTWSSSDKSVATVDAYGNVTARAVGSAVITVSNGSLTAQCSITVVPVCDHSSKRLVAAKVSTCSEKGWDAYYVCDSCGILFNLSNEMIANVPYRDYAPHEWNASYATTEHDKHCVVCGYVAQATIGHIHTGVLHKGYSATCTQPGEMDYYTCSCGQNFADPICLIAIANLDEWKVIQPLGHDFDSDWTVDRQPTCSVEGEKSHHCLRCDAVSGATSISTTAHTYGAPTSWEWAEDGTSASAVFECTRCGHNQNVSATISKGVITNGMRELTATVKMNGTTYTDVIEIEATAQYAFDLEMILDFFSFGGKINRYAGLGLVGGGALIVLTSVIIVAHSVKKRRRRRKR